MKIISIQGLFSRQFFMLFEDGARHNRNETNVFAIMYLCFI